MSDKIDSAELPKDIRTLKAFDKEALLHGNKALTFDHASISKKVDQLLSEMTLGQKVNEIRGSQVKPINGLYYAGGDDELKIPSFAMVDGPRGARSGKATAFPVAIARAASFDGLLEHRVGKAIGLEVLAKGGNVVLAPTINLLRHPGWGRAQETYSEDMHHMAVMGMAFICGAQNHVLASPKHFAINNVENSRFEMSANVDPRTLHEVYLPHFKRCITEAKASSLMSAYNKVNNIYCGEHPELLTKILREDWGFKGFVESDWFLGARSTAAALNAGLDIEMPSGYRFSDEKLKLAIEAGELDETTITKAAARCLYMKVAWKLGQDTEVDSSVVECEAHTDLAREVAEKSMVLLKNAKDILPLTDAATLNIAVVGDQANIINLGDRGSSSVNASQVSIILPALKDLAKASLTYFRDKDDLSGLGEFDVTIIVAGLTYLDEGEFIPTQQQEAEGESLARGGDRTDLRLPVAQEALIKTASQHAKASIVILQGGSGIEVAPWIDDIDALVMAWYGGCEGGKAVAKLIFGVINPSGKLPVTFPQRTADLNHWDTVALQVEHPFLHGYRHLDKLNIKPAFEFGFGLSYTSFELADLNCERTDTGFLVSSTLTNTGSRHGATVVQLYLAYPDSNIERAPFELKAFGRAELLPGESIRILMEISDSELRYYHAELGWTLEACCYQFNLGFSSRDLRPGGEWVYIDELWLAST